MSYLDPTESQYRDGASSHNAQPTPLASEGDSFTQGDIVDPYQKERDPDAHGEREPPGGEGG